MQKVFIRALWGDLSVESRKYSERRKKMDSDIELVQLNPYAVPFKALVFGKDNYKYLLSKGVDCVKISDRPYVWDNPETYHQYGHKLYALEYAMRFYDEVIFLDWDCIAVKPLPDNFWDQFHKKHVIQAILRGYKSPKCRWRGKIDSRKRCCASFIYCRDRTIAHIMMDKWLNYEIDKKSKQLSEEQIMSLCTDEMIGGWKGKEAYWKNFEPECFDLFSETYPVYDPKLLQTKDITFIHVNHSKRSSLVSRLKGTNDKKSVIDFQLQRRLGFWEKWRNEHEKADTPGDMGNTK